MKTSLTTLFLLLSLTLKAQIPFWTLSADVFSNELFSPVHVAINGDVALLCSFSYNNETGAAAVFEFNGTDWDEVQLLEASDGQEMDWFGLGAVIDGERMLIGAPNDNFVPANFSKVYYFERVDGSWEEQQIIQPDLEQGSAFGFTIDMDGDYAVVGAPDNSFGSGAAVIYHWVDGSWEEDSLLFPPAGDVHFSFGAGVAISGDWCAVGGYLNNADFQHAISMYQLIDGAWEFQQLIVNEEGTNIATTPSWNVDMDGKELIFAFRHPMNNPGDPVIGGAVFYSLNGDSWEEVQMLTDPVGDNLIGRRASMSSNFALTGISEEPAFQFDSAHQVVFYQQTNTEWEEIHRVRLPSGGINFSGCPMDVSDEFAILANPDANVAYVYDLRALIISGSTEKSVLEDVVIFPNPASDKIYISSTSNTISWYSYGQTGRLFASAQVSGYQIEVDITSWPVGCYYLQVITDDGPVGRRVLVYR